MISDLSAQEALEFLVRDPQARAWLDVRSEGEAETASIPGFENVPVLNNSERHEVGTVYKRQGQEQAISLGHRLVAPQKDARVAGWVASVRRSREQRAVVACWRGGLRSRTSAEWLAAALGEAARVELVRGGYKAMRALLLEELDPGKFTGDITVIAGPTGSGKTDLLRAAGPAALDLEALAAHRGSAFGRVFGATQPAQATFENRLFLDLFAKRLGGAGYPLVLEDESPPIGDVRLPKPVFEAITRAPVVLLEVSLEERTRRLAQQYGVQDSRTHGPERVRDSLLRAVSRIARRLGGLRAAKLSGLIEIAFARDPFRLENHVEWVSYLLVEHYDAYYRRSIERLNRKVLFKGDIKECEQWLRNKHPQA